MGRQIPFIKAIMLNSWRQRTWKNLFLFFIHIYNMYFEYQRKTTLTNQKEKIMFFMHHQVIRISFFVQKTKYKDMLRSNEVWNLFIVFVYRKQRTQAKCFSFQLSHLEYTCIRKKDDRIVWYHNYCQFIVMLLQKRKVGCQSYTKSIIKRNKEYQRAIVCSQSDCWNRIFFKM